MMATSGIVDEMIIKKMIEEKVIERRTKKIGGRSIVERLRKKTSNNL